MSRMPWRQTFLDLGKWLGEEMQKHLTGGWDCPWNPARRHVLLENTDTSIAVEMRKYPQVVAVEHYPFLEWDNGNRPDDRCLRNSNKNSRSCIHIEVDDHDKVFYLEELFDSGAPAHLRQQDALLVASARGWIGTTISAGVHAAGETPFRS